MPKYTEITAGTERDMACKYCGSEDISRNGIENGVQFYRCKSCEQRFNGNDTFPKMKYDKETIGRALTYYYNGMSFHNIKNTFDDLEGINLSRSTAWEWVNKYTKIVIPWAHEQKPTKIGRHWVADETMIMLHGKNKWLWAIIDKKTRYLLACNFTSKRYTKDATKLFRDALYNAGTRPGTITTDKLFAYNKAFNRVFYSRYAEDKVYHWKSKGFHSKFNTNLVERWHEYIKGRTKIMRHFKNAENAEIILNGIIINYNYLWEHSAIGDIPPAKKAGININKLGIKSWLDLIEIAMEFNRVGGERSDFTFFTDERERMGVA